jgi:phospholipid transport system substrate-binding protein
MKTKIRILCALTFCLLHQFSPAWSSVEDTAEQTVVTATEAIYRAIQEQCSEIQQYPLHLHKLVEEMLIPHADFRRMTQLALGKHWRTAGTEQQSEFVVQFRHLLSRTYATAVQIASLDSIHYLPSPLGEEPNTFIVHTEVRRPSEAIVTINYRLYQANEKWLVYDIVVDGISLVSNYRSTFAAQIRNNGLPELMNTLKKKNQQPLPESVAKSISKRAKIACK